MTTFQNSASHGPWVCDCLSYDLVPQPDNIGMCTTCYRPVYDDDGKRVTNG